MVFETLNVAGADDAIVDETFGVSCEDITVDETRVDVYVTDGWNLVTSDDITVPLELFTLIIDVLIVSGTTVVLTVVDVTVDVEGLTHVDNLNTPGDGTLPLTVEEGVGEEETNFKGATLLITSGVGLVPVAVVRTVTDGLNTEDRDTSVEYGVALVNCPTGLATQVLVTSGERTVPVAEIGTVTDKLGFTPTLDTDTNAAIVVAVVVATVVVGKTGGWLGKGY